MFAQSVDPPVVLIFFFEFFLLLQLRGPWHDTGRVGVPGAGGGFGWEEDYAVSDYHRSSGVCVCVVCLSLSLTHSHSVSLPLTHSLSLSLSLSLSYSLVKPRLDANCSSVIQFFEIKIDNTTK